MSIINLLRIYHSFLFKKWYLLLYIVLLFSGLLLGVAISSEKLVSEPTLKIGIVDEDQSTETQMILKTIGDGQSIAKEFTIEAVEEEHAQQRLKEHAIDGYIVFEEGMTEQFYANGQLPIRVHTYDENSVQSIVINQLADSVYSRLMLSEAGILTYAEIRPDATQEELVEIMMDMLFVGLDRQAAFQITDVQSYELGKYVVITMLFLSVFLFYWSLSTLLQMNNSIALQNRLSLYPFVREKLVLSRALFSLGYTVLFTLIMVSVVWRFTAIESYNMGYLVLIFASYLVAISLVFILCELINLPLLKLGIAVIIILLSGATIPIIYLKNMMLADLLFAQIFYALLEILHHNYVIDWSLTFYLQYFSLVVICVLFVVWRWRRR